MSKTISELKNTLEEINSQITEAEERISDLEDRMVEITATKQNIEKRMKINDNSLRNIWGNIKPNIILIIGVPEEEKEKVFEKIYAEIIVENFLNTGKEISTQSRKCRELHTA